MGTGQLVSTQSFSLATSLRCSPSTCAYYIICSRGTVRALDLPTAKPEIKDIAGCDVEAYPHLFNAHRTYIQTRWNFSHTTLSCPGNRNIFTG